MSGSLRADGSSKFGKNKISKAKEIAEDLISDAEKEAKNIKREKLLEVKDEWLKKKQDFDNEVNPRRQKLQNYEKKIELDKKFALEEAKKRFNPNGDNRFFCTTNNIEITTPKNNIKLRYYVTNENDKREVSFEIQYIKPDKNLPQKEVDELINFIN